MAENIDVHYLSGFGWLTQMCKNVEFKGVDFLPRYGSGKYTTSNADQLHVAGCGGYFKVTDCNFSMSHDDPINVHGSYMRVEEVIDNKTLKLRYINGQQGGFRQFHPGDEVLFYSRTYLEPPAGEKEDSPYVVESSVAPGEEYNGEKLDMRTEVVTFKEAFDEETLNDLKIKVTRSDSSVEGLYVAENVTYTPAVTISGNHMKSIPTRGILCTTRQPVIIEDNVFDNMAMANIYLSNDADYWYESGPIRNMIIRNNKFYIRSTGQAEWGDVSGIFVDPVVLSNVSGAPPAKGDIPVHRNITIEGNEFHMGNDNVVTAKEVDGLKIINNKIIRDDADIEIKVQPIGGIAIGEKQSIESDVTEKTLSKDIFRFSNCKNVVISGNTYDDGLNLNVTTAGSEMSEDDVTIRDDVLTLNDPNGNLITSESKLHYVTSDPSVAYVNEQGELVGAAEGSVELIAYVEWNGTVISSEPVTVTVGEESTASVFIRSDKDTIEQENGKAQLTFTEGAQLEVIDPVSKKTSDAGMVVDSTYTALKEGVVLVRASKGNRSAGILLINRFEKSYGSPDSIADTVTVDNLHKDKISGSKHEITIQAETGSELYGGSSNVNNLVKLAVPQEMENDLRIQVSVSNLPVTGNGYNNAGILLYKDGDNYYSIGKKGHMSGVTTVYENKANPSERAGDSEDNTLTSAVFEIVVSQGTVTMNYQKADGTWKKADSQSGIEWISEDGQLYLALCAWQNSGLDFAASFSNVKMAKASETTQDMSGIEAVRLFDAIENKAPVISAVTLNAGKVNETATAAVFAEDEDGKVTRTVYMWELTGSDGNTMTAYTDKNTYVPTQPGRLKVTAVALDAYGKPSQIKSSDTVEIKVEQSMQEELKHLYINGNEVNDFDRADARFMMPQGSSGKLRVSYDAENAGVATIIKDGSGNVLAELKDENEAVVDLCDTLVIERGSTVYKIKIAEQEKGDTALTSLTVNKTAVDLNDEIRKGTDSYFVRLNEDSALLNLQTSDPQATLSMTRSFFDIEVANESGEKGVYQADVDLTAGINAFYVTVTGADGISSRTVRLYLFCDGHNDSALSDIRVNGTSLKDFDPQQKEYTIYTSEKQISVDVRQGAARQSTSITKDNVRSEGTSAVYDLKSGLNQIIVANVSENLWTISYYTLNVVVEDEANADLLALSCDETMTPAFDPLYPEVMDYSITMHDDQLHIEAQAVMDTAQVKVFSNTEEISAQGSVRADMNIYEGMNTIYVEVTSPDESTVKTYVLSIEAQGLEYASDRMDLASKQEVGYGKLELDRSSSGGDIALMNENGGRVVFAKGLGAHAQSEIVYDIGGQDYDRFEAYVGIDYYQVAQGNVPSSVTFRVLADGVEKFNSGEMTVKDPMQKVEIDLSGVQTLQLIADMGVNNYNDHADWADAKFIRPLSKQPETDKTKLTALIREAENYNEEDHTTDSWASLQEALNQAKAVADDENASQLTVDRAIEQLQTAIDGLEKAPAVTDKTLLAEMIAAVEKMQKGEYTDESWNALQQQLKDAKAVMNDESAVQDEIDEAVKALETAVRSLEKEQPSVEIDTSELEALLGMAEHLDLDKFTKESAKTVYDAIEVAKAVLNDPKANQDEVDAATAGLQKAVDALTLKRDDDAQTQHPDDLDNETADTAASMPIAMFAMLFAGTGAALILLRKKHHRL